MRFKYLPAQTSICPNALNPNHHVVSVAVFLEKAQFLRKGEFADYIEGIVL